MSRYYRRERPVLAFRVTEDFQSKDYIPGWVADLMFKRKLNISTNELFPGFEIACSDGRGRLGQYGDWVIKTTDGQIEFVGWFKFKTDYRSDEVE